MEFKDRLKALRKENHLTQVQLAKMLNYSYTAIANYESGRNEPSIKDLKKIAAIFHVSLDYLLCVTNIRYPQMEDESMQFQELKQCYGMLDKQSKEELLHYSQWLASKQTIVAENGIQTELRVAQDIMPYKTE